MFPKHGGCEGAEALKIKDRIKVISVVININQEDAADLL